MIKEPYTDREFLLENELEYYKKLGEILMKINKISDKEAYLIEEITKYKYLIERLKELDLYEYEVDYDWDENPYDSYFPADLDYHIENILKCYEYDKENFKQDNEMVKKIIK